MDINAILAGLMPAEDGFSATITDNWRQGRTSFGGISAAIALEAAQRTLGDLPPLRSAQFAFIGPASGAVRAVAAPLRRGRSTVFATVDLIGEEGIALRGTLCFGAARTSAVSHADLKAPNVPRPEACPPAFAPGGRAPGFVQNFDIHDASGGDRSKPERLLWLRHRAPTQPTSIAALVALADVPPPSAINLFAQPGPVSTMTWMLDILAETPTSADGWYLIRNIADTVAEGYSSQGSTLWKSDGEPLIAARQNVAVFA